MVKKKIDSSTQLFFFSVFTCTIEFLGCIVFDDPSLLVAGLLPLIFCLTQVTKRSVPCGISRQRVQHVWTDKKTDKRKTERKEKEEEEKKTGQVATIKTKKSIRRTRTTDNLK